MAKVVAFKRLLKNNMTRKLNRKKLERLISQLQNYGACCYRYQYANNQSEMFEMSMEDCLLVEKIANEMMKILKEGI